MGLCILRKVLEGSPYCRSRSGGDRQGYGEAEGGDEERNRYGAPRTEEGEVSCARYVYEIFRGSDLPSPGAREGGCGRGGEASPSRVGTQEARGRSEATEGTQPNWHQR